MAIKSLIVLKDLKTNLPLLEEVYRIGPLLMAKYLLLRKETCIAQINQLNRLR